MRKTKDVTIAAEGRDTGKIFRLTEMPAAQAEAWAIRAFLAMASSGIDIPEEIGQAGMAGIAQFGIKAMAGVTWELAKPLMDEMFECVQVVPDKSKPKVARGLVDTDIEEVKTRLTLRKEILALHTGFFSPAAAQE
jgi:hypothetical protein